MKIIEAAKNGDLVLLKELIDLGENILEKDNNGKTALHWAAINNNEELVEFLVGDCKIPVNCEDNDGKTAFFESCVAENWDIALLLADLGAKMDLYLDGTAPILLASASLQIDLIKAMIESHVDTSVKTEEYNDNSLHLAAMAESNNVYENLEVLKLLWNAKTPIITNKDGLTPYDYLATHDKSFSEMFREYVDPDYHSALLGH